MLTKRSQTDKLAITSSVISILFQFVKPSSMLALVSQQYMQKLNIFLKTHTHTHTNYSHRHHIYTQSQIWHKILTFERNLFLMFNNSLLSKSTAKLENVPSCTPGQSKIYFAVPNTKPMKSQVLFLKQLVTSK